MECEQKEHLCRGRPPPPGAEEAGPLRPSGRTHRSSGAGTGSSGADSAGRLSLAGRAERYGWGGVWRRRVLFSLEVDRLAGPGPGLGPAAPGAELGRSSLLLLLLMLLLMGCWTRTCVR